MAFDASLNLGNLVQIIVLIVGIIIFFSKQSTTHEWMKGELNYMKSEMKAIQTEIKLIGETLAKLKVIDFRVTRLEDDVKKLQDKSGS